MTDKLAVSRSDLIDAAREACPAWGRGRRCGACLATPPMRFAAACALADEVNAAAWRAAQAGGCPTARHQGEMRAAAVHCNEVALNVVTAVSRFSGGSAIYDGNVLQQ